MTMKILVTGGTGTLGRLTVPLLIEPETAVRVLSRHHAEVPDGVEHVVCDLKTGDGLERALDGIDVVLHLAGGASGDDKTTRRLVAAAEAAAVRHLILISVVGADAMPISYFTTKHRAELIVEESTVPHTLLRVAQVNDLLLRAARAVVTLPVVPMPRGLRAQPVDAREVAHRLAQLTLEVPAGRVEDLVGPDVMELGELLRSYARITGRRRLYLPIRVPGKVGAAYREGRNLTLTGSTTTRTWADFLAERAPANSPS
ncbi:SDR family oxidoreductase [Brachybacterium sp. FME24]|uniref:SDR family oxidoreductase n=1 Tax=Brachybacterium sp. FME24 TaxID=2742605 RepID=UPI0018692CCD|nr:NAD(P)H-binding protein [Brachybacterium sp. FME24]